MRLSRKLVSFFAGTAMLAGVTSGPAAAAEIFTPFIPDWAGPQFSFFFGLPGGLGGGGGGGAPSTFGAMAGFSMTNGRMVFGGDLTLGINTVVSFANVRARVGALVRPRLQAYLHAGFVYVPILPTPPGPLHFTAGGGLDFAITHDISVFAEVTAIRINIPPAIYIPVWNVGVTWRP
jgi:hypothetical protein